MPSRKRAGDLVADIMDRVFRYDSLERAIHQHIRDERRAEKLVQKTIRNKEHIRKRKEDLETRLKRLRASRNATALRGESKFFLDLRDKEIESKQRSLETLKQRMEQAVEQHLEASTYLRKIRRDRNNLQHQWHERKK